MAINAENPDVLGLPHGMIKGSKITAKHLLLVVKQAARTKGIKMPKLHADNIYSVADCLKHNFSSAEIRAAHYEVVEFYRTLKGDKHSSSYDGSNSSTYSNNNPAYNNKNYTFRGTYSDYVIPPEEKNKDAEKVIEVEYNTVDNDTNNGVTDQKTATQENKTDNSEYVLKSVYEKEQKEQTDTLLNILRPLQQKINGNETFAENIFAIQRTMQDDLDKVTKKVKSIVELRPTVLELKTPEMAETKKLGVVHKNFPDLLIACNARNRDGTRGNIWLYGPPGTGKTKAAQLVAEALGLPFLYNGSLASAFQVFGYTDANGNYISTAFRKAWEHGGVYLFDEIDGSMPDALLALQGALSGDIASFPDKMVMRHKDCVIIAGANTTGLGGGVEYIGTMKQNIAFLDRFSRMAWPHDDGLESALCANQKWLEYVRHVRSNWQNAGIKGILITMRATLKGESLLAAGMSWDTVVEIVLKGGMSDAQWQQIK